MHLEVRRITYVVSQGLAMAELYDGAIIDGKPVSFGTIFYSTYVQYGKPGVLVKYERSAPNQPDQFQAEIRQVEQKLQINPRDSVPVQVVTGFNAFR